MKKGIAFPTCISVNNCVCHFSPIRSEPDYLLKDGDLVKIDLGAHIDGFIAVAAFTTIVGISAEKPATGRKADTVLAAYWSSQAALRLLKSGNEVRIIIVLLSIRLDPNDDIIVARNEFICVYLHFLTSNRNVI